MGQLIHLSGPEPSSRPQPTRKKPPEGRGLAGIQLTPPVITGIILAVVLLAGAFIMFARPGALNPAANTPMMDTGTVTTVPGAAEQHANGMDSSTESPSPPAANNGMDSSTGH